MGPMYYIGLDVHKRRISYCVKESGGRIHSEGSIPATRLDVDHWLKTLPQPWSAAPPYEAVLKTNSKPVSLDLVLFQSLVLDPR